MRRGQRRRRGPPRGHGATPGHGLIGMRERVAVYGGELSAGPATGRRLASSARPAAPGERGVSIRVLLVDDQALLRTGFRMILRGPARHRGRRRGRRRRRRGRAGARALRARRRADGRADAGHGRHRGDAPRSSADGSRRRGCSILTTFDLDEYAFAALRAGASGFLLKDVPPAELLARDPGRRRRRRGRVPARSPAGCSTASRCARRPPDEPTPRRRRACSAR